MAEERSRIPKVKALPSADELRKLPLTPVDGFVLSRVDGTSSEEDIIGLTGLPREQVHASLQRLVSLSLVTLGDEAPARLSSGMNHRSSSDSPASGRAPAPPTSDVDVTTKSARSPSAPSPSSPSSPSPSSSSSSPAPSSASSTSPPAAAATSRAGDLTTDEQARINDLHAQLETLDHYALLGVTRTVDKKDIKRAYFERAALYHPDRYFRRNVGELKPKLEAIFGRITVAHDVLTNKTQRAEYDAYLDQVAHTRALEERVKRAEETVRSAAVIEVPDVGGRIVTPLGGSVPPVAAPAPSPVPPPSGEPVRRQSRPIVPIDQQARRDLLAKHLRGGRSLTPSKVPAAPAVPVVDPDALKRHYDQRKQDVARAQALRHRNAGDQARASGDAIAAASSYKAALTFTPDDAELQRLYQETSSLSESALVETYRSQAAYEEKNGRWQDAAHSWSKVAQIAPSDAGAQERAANALLEARGNLHEAASFAQRAVNLAPSEPLYRKLLARIYLEAGLLKNARRELDAAEQLAPHDVTIAALAKRLAEATGR